MKKLGYQIASRATILLGREGVSRSDGALIELIKNAYDADASFCFVYFDQSHDRIVIIDDGTGMTQKIISSSWMTIGTDNKKTEYVSEKHRIKSGEKGIGRFALDRLGRVCKMYTKHASERLIYWEMDWSEFEKAGQMLEQVKAKFEYREDSFDVTCSKFVNDFPEALARVLKRRGVQLETGTILEITSLRDSWSKAEIGRVKAGLGTLLPPKEQGVFNILLKENETAAIICTENVFDEDFDYRMVADFDGRIFKIRLYRNELNIAGIPKAFFKRPGFANYPYRFEDFSEKPIVIEKTIPELLVNDNSKFIEIAERVGKFSFDFKFLKRSESERKYCSGFHREIKARRKEWMEQFAGVKIYRDNFVVRPYGDVSSNSFDWLRLDARKSADPVAVSDQSLRWHVSNSQVQATLFVSRIDNPNIADKSSREGLIENQEFDVLCMMLRALISIFERDRAYVESQIKQYSDEINEVERVKEEAAKLARAELSRRALEKSEGGNESADAGQNQTYAKAIQYFHDEIEELASEIKMMRALATNGLITSALVHDLKTIKALLVVRVKTLQHAIESGSSDLVLRNIDNLRLNDEFLKSWITVVTDQTQIDRRKRTKEDVVEVIANAIKLMNPIFDRKHIVVKLESGVSFKKRIFRIDFESMIYNLLINSIEAFAGCERQLAKREIRVRLALEGDSLRMDYSDSGPGLAEMFKKDPYAIFNYGVTSKVDREGNKIGTGLGMYIVSTNVNDYKGKLALDLGAKGFALTMVLPGDVAR